MTLHHENSLIKQYCAANNVLCMRQNDGVTNILDLDLFRLAEFDGNGSVNIVDLEILRTFFPMEGLGYAAIKS